MGTSYNYTDAKFNLKRSTGIPSRSRKMKKSIKVEPIAYNFDIPQQRLVFLRWNDLPGVQEAYCLPHTPTLILATYVHYLEARRRCDRCSQFGLFSVTLGGKRIGTHVIRREK